MAGERNAGSAFEIRDLQDFEPLVDAVVFSLRDVRVDLFSPGYDTDARKYRMNSKKASLLLPEAVAVLLCCRGMAEIG